MTDKQAMWLYQTLLDLQGHQGWWPAQSPIEMAIGAILTQNTAWKNVEYALDNLRGRGLMDAQKILDTPDAELGELLRPSGYFNIKTRRLKSLMQFLVDNADGDPATLSKWELARARTSLLGVKGVGPETADSILLYGSGHKIFVIDAYTRRIAGRLALVDPKAPYDDLRLAFEGALPKGADLFKDYHAQLVVHGKDRCRPKPLCDECPFLDQCPGAFVQRGRG